MVQLYHADWAVSARKERKSPYPASQEAITLKGHFHPLFSLFP